MLRLNNALINYSLLKKKGIHTLFECNFTFKRKMNQTFTIGNQSAPFNSTTRSQLATLIASISISSICCFLGTVANLIVLIILRKKGNQRTVFDLTITSLSVTDLLACLTGNGFIVYQTTPSLFLHKNDATKDSSRGLAGLKIAGFFLFLSLLHILLITFQRFLAIFWPIKYRHVMTKSLIKKLIAMTWIVLLILWPVLTSIVLLKRVSPINGIIIFALGAIVSTIYVMIAVKSFLLVKKKQFNWKAEHRVLLKSFGVTISYFACFSPYAYFTLMKRSFSANEYDFIMTLTLTNFVLDPLFYFYFSYWLNRRDENRRNNSS